MPVSTFHKLIKLVVQFTKDLKFVSGKKFLRCFSEKALLTLHLYSFVTKIVRSRKELYFQVLNVIVASQMSKANTLNI